MIVVTFLAAENTSIINQSPLSRLLSVGSVLGVLTDEPDRVHSWRTLCLLVVAVQVQQLSRDFPGCAALCLVTVAS